MYPNRIRETIHTTMKTNDQKEFETWWKQNMPNPDWLTSDHSTDVYKAWEAACKYKDKEIEDLKNKLEASDADVDYVYESTKKIGW